MKKKKLLEAIQNKKQEIYDLVNQDKLEEAEAAKKELCNLQKKYELIEDLEEDADEEAGNEKNFIDRNKMIDFLEKKKAEDKEKMENVFVKGLKAGIGKAILTEEETKILNAMKEGTEKDGGLTVPIDIKTQIEELRRAEDALETLVNVEKVNTESGSRVIEELADQTPFDNVDEEADFPEVDTPTLRKIEYKIKKKGGILIVTNELLEDSAVNIIAYLKKWIAKKAKATRNFMILKKAKEITTGKEIEIAGLDDLKDIFNVTLDPAIAAISVVVTNQDGFNWLDKLKDKDGNYLLQKDPTKPTQKLLFGVYPVKRVGNKTLKTEEGKIPFFIGSLKEAITIFDREKLSLTISEVAGDLWKTDRTGIKVRERLDIKEVDTDAIVLAQVAGASTLSARVAKK